MCVSVCKVYNTVVSTQEKFNKPQIIIIKLFTKSSCYFYIGMVVINGDILSKI